MQYIVLKKKAISMIVMVSVLSVAVISPAMVDAAKQNYWKIQSNKLEFSQDGGKTGEPMMMTFSYKYGWGPDTDAACLSAKNYELRFYTPQQGDFEFGDWDSDTLLSSVLGTTDATVCGSYELAKMGENGETHATCITKVSETKFGAKIKYIDNSDFESNPATSADVSLDGSTGNANYASQKHHMVLRTKYSDTAENHYQYKDKENFTISVSGADGASTDTLTGSTYKTNGVIDAYIAKADLCKTKTNKGQSINTSQKTVLVRFTPTASTGDLSEISIPVMSRIWTFDGVNEGGKYSDNKQVRALSIYGSQDSLSVRSIKNKNAGDFISTTAGDNTFEVSVKNNTKVPQMVDVKYFATNDSDANVFTVGNYTDTLTGSVSIEGGKTLKFETSNLNGTSLSDGSDAFIHVGVFVGSDLIHTNTIKTVSRDPGSKMLLSWTKQFSSSTSANGSSVNFSAMIFNTGTKSYTGSLSLYASKDAACNSSDTLISQQDVKIIQPGKKKSLRFSKSKIFDVLSPSEYITICADITDGVSSTTWNWNIYDKKNKENPTAESGVISSGKQTLNTFDDLEGPDYFIPTGTFWFFTSGMSAVSELAIYDKKFDFEFAIERNKLRNVAGKIDFIIDLYDGADTVKTYKKSITPPLNTLDTTASGSVTIDISDLSFEGDGYTYRLEKQGTVLIPEQVAPIAFPTRSNPSFPGTISGNTYTGVTEVPEKYSVVKVYCTDDSVITLPSSTIGNGQTYDLGSCIPESNKQSFRYSTVQYSNSGGSVVPSLDY